MSTTPASGTAGNRPAAEVGQGSSLAVPRRSPAPRSFTYALRTRLRGARTANGWLACFVYDAPAPGWTPCAVVALCVCDRGASTRAPAPTDPANHVYDAPGCSYNTRDNVCNPSNYTYDARNSVYDTQNCLVAIIWTAVASPPTVDATPLCLKRAASATGHGPLAPTLVVASQARRPPAGQDAIPAPRPYILADDVLGQVSGFGFHVSAQTRFLHDGHGSTRLLTDSTGAITDRFSFDAWGNMLGGNPGVSNPAETSRLYSGEEYCGDLQWNYHRARYYDMSAGVWNQMDPLKGDTSEPQSLHKYSYCGADGVNGADPSGQFAMAALVAGIAVASIMMGMLLPAAAQNAPTKGIFRLGVLIAHHKGLEEWREHWKTEGVPPLLVDHRANQSYATDRDFFRYLRLGMSQAGSERKRTEEMARAYKLTLLLDVLDIEDSMHLEMPVLLARYDLLIVVAHGGRQEGSFNIGYRSPYPWLDSPPGTPPTAAPTGSDYDKRPLTWCSVSNLLEDRTFAKQTIFFVSCGAASYFGAHGKRYGQALVKGAPALPGSDDVDMRVGWGDAFNEMDAAFRAFSQ